MRGRQLHDVIYAPSTCTQILSAQQTALLNLFLLLKVPSMFLSVPRLISTYISPLPSKSQLCLQPRTRNFLRFSSARELNICGQFCSSVGILVEKCRRKRGRTFLLDSCSFHRPIANCTSSSAAGESKSGTYFNVPFEALSWLAWPDSSKYGQFSCAKSNSASPIVRAARKQQF